MIEKKGVWLWRRLKSVGDMNAQEELDSLYSRAVNHLQEETGDGRSTRTANADRGLGLALLEEAADLGHARAQYALGRLCGPGGGALAFECDDERCFRLARRAGAEISGIRGASF